MAKDEMEVREYTWSVQDVEQLSAGKVSIRSPLFSTNWRLIMTKIVEEDDVKEDDVKEDKENSSNNGRTLQSSSFARKRKFPESKEYLGVYIQHSNNVSALLEPILIVNFSILGLVNGPPCSRAKVIFKVVPSRHYGFSDFISIAELNKNNLQNLKIHCKIAEVIQDFKTSRILLKNNIYSDVEFHISDKKIPAHRVILALSSETFRERFAEQDSMKIFKIDSKESEEFEKLLKYIYTGEVIHTSNQETLNLYLATIRYQIIDLQRSCFEYMERFFTREELFRIFPPFIKAGFNSSNMNDLSQLCAKYVARNEKLILEDDFKAIVKVDPVFLVETLRKVSKRKAEWWRNLMSDTSSMCKLPLPQQPSQEKQLFATVGDIQIEVGDKTYFAHKEILTSKSPVFERMFANYMSETITGVVKITDIRYQVFYEVLRFMYTNEIEASDFIVKGILIAADKYDINDLQLICERMIMKTVNRDNCLEIVKFAEYYNAHELKKYCLYYIISKLTIYNFGLYILNILTIGEDKAYQHLLLEMMNIIYEAIIRSQVSNI